MQSGTGALPTCGQSATYRNRWEMSAVSPLRQLRGIRLVSLMETEKGQPARPCGHVSASADRSRRSSTATWAASRLISPFACRSLRDFASVMSASGSVSAAAGPRKDQTRPGQPLRSARHARTGDWIDLRAIGLVRRSRNERFPERYSPQRRTIGRISGSQLNVTVCMWPLSFDDVFDTICRLPIIPTSAALSSTVCG